MVPRFGPVDFSVHLRLFQEGQNSGSPTVQSVAILVDGIRRWELLVSRLVVQQSEGDLLHVVAALHSACSFPRRLNRRNQQCRHDSSANHEYKAQSTKYRDNDDGGAAAIFPRRVCVGHHSRFPELRSRQIRSSCPLYRNWRRNRTGLCQYSGILTGFAETRPRQN